MQEVSGMTPEDADMRFYKILFQIAARTFRILDPTLLRSNLHTKTAKKVSAHFSLQRKNGIKHYPKIPVLHLKAQEQKAGARQGAEHAGWNSLPVRSKTNQKSNEIVFREDPRCWIREIAE